MNMRCCGKPYESFNPPFKSNFRNDTFYNWLQCIWNRSNRRSVGVNQIAIHISVWINSILILIYWIWNELSSVLPKPSNYSWISAYKQCSWNSDCVTRVNAVFFVYVWVPSQCDNNSKIWMRHCNANLTSTQSNWMGTRQSDVKIKIQ